MNEQQALKRKISAVQFAVWELHLFLNTHPNNREALEKFKENSEKCEKLVHEYEEKFGPIRAASANGDQWTWINDPWPWETEANA